MPFSRFAPITQCFASHALPDAAQAVTEELTSQKLGTNLRPGSRIAIGVGSRGISNIADIVRATVAYFHGLGIHPFIVPAMGSHGGGTVDGQLSVLEHYGVTESSVGCPVVSSLDVIPFGTTAEGFDT